MVSKVRGWWVMGDGDQEIYDNDGKFQSFLILRLG